MEPKLWYQSKVVWLNVITTVALVLGALLTALSTTPEPVSPWIAWAVGIALAVANVVMRVWFTSEPINAKPPTQ